MTNYPKGESLYSPVNYVSLVQSTFMSTISKVTGPICAYNLYNIFSYLTTSLLMFAFMLYLTKSRWIAFLSGYAVAFTPYVQSKIGGHPSYGYASLLIAIIWLSLHILKYKKEIHAVLLAFVLALCFYIDPYFILLSLTVCVPIALSFGLFYFINRHKQKEFEWRKLVKPLVVLIITTLILLAPIIFVRIRYSDEINASVGGVRGDVLATALGCSNRPLDYILPDPYNVYLSRFLGPKYTSANVMLRNWCNSGESRVSVSLTLVTIATFGGAIMLWEILSKRKLKLDKFMPYKPVLVLSIIFGFGLLAFLIGLPPYLGGFITISGLILKVTSTWRIFAREYLLVNLSVIMFAAIVLKFMSQSNAFKYRRKTCFALMAAIFIGVFIEYQINPPFKPPVFSYSHDVPSIYQDVKNDSSIKVLAEYPIDKLGIEYDSSIYYLTMQAVHGKKLFNSGAMNDSNSSIHLSLRDLADPQTIPALRYLGIRYVMVHGIDSNKLTNEVGGLSIVGETSTGFPLTSLRPGDNGKAVLAKITDGPSDPNILTIQNGLIYNQSIIQSPVNSQFELAHDSELREVNLGGKKVTDISECFDIKTFSTKSDDLAVEINGRNVMVVRIDRNYRPINLTINTGDVIKLHSSSEDLILDNLGCR